MALFPSPTKTWHNNTYPSLSPSLPALSAAGKTVVITGGGTGIGAETAHFFARAGATHIGLVGRRAEPLLATKNSIESQFPSTKVSTAQADVAKKDQVEAAFATILGDEEKIDVLVSGAAIVGPLESVADVDPEQFWRGIEVNVMGALYTAKAFLKYASTEESVAVEINSSAAHINFGPGFPSYSAAKLAAYRVWDSVGFANSKVRVYHVQPGVVDTDMNREAGGVKATGIEDHVSLPASFILWLASPEARFLKGKFLWANWDVDELKARADEIANSTELNIVLGGWPFGNPSWKAVWNDDA
ncbi:hypothetical protein QBC47DRAFT_455889 [Echria macrotheca]|uniref:Ketoreductase domain-containing protein n=1 Tax=Echria macrotheca TaxID=438768 RepID=A0AAJ0BLB5_9PEZI|nr:hypothetical protein QBC47DRAFT_455889 [Echria macrotheca]